MNVTNIKYSTEMPSMEAYASLYHTTGWNDDADKQMLYNGLKNSWYFIAAYEEERLVGLGRVISDGYLHAYINEMMILPAYQHQGIGREIVERLIERIKSYGIDDIQLFCAKGKREFYLKSGFIERPEDAPGMQYRKSQK